MCHLTDGRCFRKIDLEIEFLKQGLAPRAAGVGSNLISCFSLLFHLDPCPFGWDIFSPTDFKKQCENVIRRKGQGKMVAFFRWSREWYVLFYLFFSDYFVSHFVSFWFFCERGMGHQKGNLRLSLPVAFLSSTKQIITSRINTFCQGLGINRFSLIDAIVVISCQTVKSLNFKVIASSVCVFLIYVSFIVNSIVELQWRLAEPLKSVCSQLWSYIFLADWFHFIAAIR